MQFPHSANELLDLLEELIPEPQPKPHQTPEDVMYEAGRRSVIHTLRALKEGRVNPVLREKRGEGRIVRRQDT